MEDIRDFFRESDSGFTIFVVEQRFAVGRGNSFFKSYKGKENLIDSNRKIMARISSILHWINKRVPIAAELVSACFNEQTSLGMVDLITALSKLFSVESHQAAGPDVIDPIIIQEGNVLPKYLNQLIHLHKESILRPAIIILLKDNDFDRARELLTGCPNGTNIKMIRNSGESVMYKVVNIGAKDIPAFLDAFSTQCFGTCSCTKRELLLNKEWAGNSIVKTFAPDLMRIRASLLCDEKSEVSVDIQTILQALSSYNAESAEQETILRAFRCIAHLNNAFCNDIGSSDITAALELAKSIENDLLIAHVYRYANFMPNKNFHEKSELLQVAQAIFEKYGVADQAIYCANNRIVRQFDTDHVNVRDFLNLRNEAIHNVPGLVGMSHIYNNTGVAQLMTGDPGEAATSFSAALDYARQPERSVQKLAIISNGMIAKSYDLQHIDEAEIRRALNLIFDNMGMTKLPFLSARYAMNIIAVAFKQSPALGEMLLNETQVEQLVQKALDANRFGSAQLQLQMQYLQHNFQNFDMLDRLHIPSNLHIGVSIRNEYVKRNGFNPIFFSTWL